MNIFYCHQREVSNGIGIVCAAARRSEVSLCCVSPWHMSRKAKTPRVKLVISGWKFAHVLLHSSSVAYTPLHLRSLSSQSVQGHFNFVQTSWSYHELWTIEEVWHPQILWVLFGDSGNGIWGILKIGWELNYNLHFVLQRWGTIKTLDWNIERLWNSEPEGVPPY